MCSLWELGQSGQPKSWCPWPRSQMTEQACFSYEHSSLIDRDDNVSAVHDWTVTECPWWLGSIAISAEFFIPKVHHLAAVVSYNSRQSYEQRCNQNRFIQLINPSWHLYDILLLKRFACHILVNRLKFLINEHMTELVATEPAWPTRLIYMKGPRLKWLKKCQHWQHLIGAQLREVHMKIIWIWCKI